MPLFNEIYVYNFNKCILFCIIIHICVFSCFFNRVFRSKSPERNIFCIYMFMILKHELTLCNVIKYVSSIIYGYTFCRFLQNQLFLDIYIFFSFLSFIVETCKLALLRLKHFTSDLYTIFRQGVYFREISF